MDRLRRRIDDKTIERDALTKANKLASESNKQFYNDATKFHVIVNRAETLETKRNLTMEALKQVRAGITELPGLFHSYSAFIS